MVFNRIPATQYHSCHVWRTQYFISHIDVSRFLVDTMFSSWWPKHVSQFRNVTGDSISARAMWVCSMKISMWGYLPSCRYVGTTDPCHENFIRGDELTNCTWRISKFRNSEFQRCPFTIRGLSMLIPYTLWSQMTICNVAIEQFINDITYINDPSYKVVTLDSYASQLVTSHYQRVFQWG